MIHPSAIIHPHAEIAEDVEIGPYTLIHENVSIGSGCRIGSHVLIKGPCRIGKDNHIFQFCSIGDDPQDKKFNADRQSELIIGDRNTIREYVSINRGTCNGGGKTVIGHDNWIMSQVHIAHDCIIGNHTIFSNSVGLAGHVIVDDHAILSGFAGVHQFCHIGRHSFLAAYSAVNKDIPPFLLVAGHFAKQKGLNKEGMKRHQYTPLQINAMKKAYSIVYRSNITLKEALDRLLPMTKESKEVTLFYDFIQSSERGVVR